MNAKNNLFLGCVGYQLERAFGLNPNNSNLSDFTNFELKQMGRNSMITFGD
jgi:hypothetical protein